MVTKLVFTLAAGVALSQAAYCPIFGCDFSLSNEVCGTVSSVDNFLVNANGCESGYECSGIALTQWADTYVTGMATDYLCTKLPELGSTDTEYVYTVQPCGTKQLNRNFKSQQSLVTCTLDTDCLLDDDTTTTCECTLRLDGLGVCLPDISNEQVYANYWNDCGTTNTLETEDEYIYWTYYIAYWTFLQGDLPCMKTFTEWNAMEEAKDNYDGAAELTVGILALAAIY